MVLEFVYVVVSVKRLAFHGMQNVKSSHEVGNVWCGMTFAGEYLKKREWSHPMEVGMCGVG